MYIYIYIYIHIYTYIGPSPASRPPAGCCAGWSSRPARGTAPHVNDNNNNNNNNNDTNK